VGGEPTPSTFQYLNRQPLLRHFDLEFGIEITEGRLPKRRMVGLEVHHEALAISGPIRRQPSRSRERRAGEAVDRRHDAL
jgi:hypothetical protein